MAKKRRKIFRRQADRSWKERKPKPKPKKPTERQRKREAELTGMRLLIRQAAKSGAAEAIEHCRNFWSVSNGYKKYIDHQIAAEADALMAAVKASVASTIRSELSLREIANRRRKPKRK